MELSSEDVLRLNVLLAGEVQAIRLDEATMTLHALTGRGEASIKLHPTGKEDQYLRLVRELLSGHALGSPGGFPVYLRRWTRMGQNLGEHLDRLLLLGEPEAVISVAYSPKITDELARRAWWAMPTADNARRMLERECVAQGAMGPVLAQFLIDYLPFETEPHTIMDTVRIVLQPGLVDDQVRQRLWNKGAHDNAYYVGFLERQPDALPLPMASRPDWEVVHTALGPLIAAGDPCARQLDRTLSGAGQAFLHICAEVLRRPANHDVVNALLNALAAYFAPVRPEFAAGENPAAVMAEVAALCGEESGQAAAVLKRLPGHGAEVRAILFLSRMDAGIAAPILNRTSAVGTLMRKKLEPVTGPILEQMAVLRGG
jgi:hypothetical protein